MDIGVIPPYLRAKVLSTDVSKLCGIRGRYLRHEALRKDQIQIQKESQDSLQRNRILIELIGLRMQRNYRQSDGSTEAYSISRVAFSCEFMGMSSKKVIMRLDTNPSQKSSSHGEATSSDMAALCAEDDRSVQKEPQISLFPVAKWIVKVAVRFRPYKN